MQTYCLKRTKISQKDIPTGRDRNEDWPLLAPITSPKWLQRLPLGHACILPYENTQLCALNSAQLFHPTFTVCETSSVGTAEHMLRRRKSNAQVSWERRTMVHTMQYIGIFFPLYHPVIFTLQRSVQLPQMRSVELQVRSHGPFGVMWISWFCLWDGHLQFSWADKEVFALLT